MSSSGSAGAAGPGWGSGPPQVPSCFRHPERETYIRCARCNRPICPDCMTEASVGFHCPECVRAGSATMRQAKTLFGGRVHRDPGLLTKVLIGLNVLLFLVQSVVPGFDERFWMVGLGLIDGQPGGVADGEYYRLLTAAFLHGGIAHLLFNMYALFVFGPMLEGALGRLRFLALYLGSALAGSAVSYAFSEPFAPSVGASGAIFGLLGATLVLTKRMRYNPTLVAGLIAVNLVLGFIIPRIDWRAHLGGLLAGVLIALAFVYSPTRWRTPVGIAAVVLVAAGIAVVVVTRTAELTTSLGG